MSNYSETIAWLFKQLPMYQRQGQVAYKADLSNTLALMDHLEHPHHSFKSVHVAGTNGKGSVSHMLASVLQEAGYKTGLYTSPHLKDFRERIKIDGAMITEDEVASFVQKHQHFFEDQALSFFEMTVGLAFDYFRKENVDIAIVEVGMGGRLDSTNVVVPEVSVITNIGLDHTQFLGSSIAAIAREKAGIIKEGVPVVIGEIHEQSEPVFQEIAEAKHAPLVFAEHTDWPNYELPLKGTYQKKNLKTVLATLQSLRNQGWNISEEHLQLGLQNVLLNTGLQGRWQVLGTAPTIICDTAHNREGLTYVLQQLAEEPYEQLHIVMGVVNDKDLDSILPLFPKAAHYYFATPDVPRGLPALQLQEIAQRFDLQGAVFESVAKALEAAKNAAHTTDLIFVGGSTFTVAEVV
ncbi:bifunctional folylpolyglutamate synthase/dihydrofolate synthase [Altibacter sp. HG106]|uniref:bifunctional folylpolyglutamate synthase/dihydrofolate synthase n=1 Tax=Altibacter sp. HG106 TaxID=3023937 RepID=UPI0023501984|nr:folylpolyglutamate synthase/dihydrofolate synthase family protein [Altibacter sp. HG106]MDC7995934.1 bifunctional folylpolyglutamate synthase/dihydrofolate synthase [Altibacter sp. HG106]